MKDSEDYTNKLKDTLCSETGRVNGVKMTILLRATYRFSSTPIKIPMAFSTDRKKILKFA